MSWPEVKKINSDFVNEPLNFNNYINDISTFGSYSYVLDEQNSNLWHDLIKSSLTMFGHDSIHDTVLNRFTDSDVDIMIEGNGRLGQSFNSFYSTDLFASGNINVVLKNLATAAYNKLDIKFQNGINRYISAKTSENAGAWLTSVFDIDMSSYQTMDDLLADTDFWTSTVESNESLRFVISLSVSSAEYMASHTDSSIYVSFIETVAQSTDATMTLINALAGTSQLETFFANESVCTAIANSAPSMTAICYNTDGFAAMIASETAMNIVSASETAVNVIIDGITNATNSESVLDGIKGNLTSIEESLPSIANTETVISEVADVKENITGVVTSLQKVTSQTDILIANIDALLSSETAISAILESSTARMALYNNAEKIETKLASSSAVISAMKKSANIKTVSVASYNTPGVAYNGKAFVIEVWSSQSAQGSGNIYLTFSHGNYIVGNATLYARMDTNHANVRKFADKVTSNNSAGYSYSTNALIFII